MLEDEKGSDDRAQGKELAKVLMRVAELEGELDERKGETAKLQDDGRRSREGLRDELRRAEVETHDLREKVMIKPIAANLHSKKPRSFPLPSTTCPRCEPSFPEPR